MSRAQLVGDTWAAFSEGNLEAVRAVLAPDAKWRAVEDGPWNCESRNEIITVMGERLANGFQGRIEEVIEDRDRAIVAFRPDRQQPGAWPLDNGIRYVVLTFRDELIVEMKGCADRAAAVAYAGFD